MDGVNRMAHGRLVVRHLESIVAERLADYRRSRARSTSIKAMSPTS
jgi:hypothetical protein